MNRQNLTITAAAAATITVLLLILSATTDNTQPDVLLTTFAMLAWTGLWVTVAVAAGVLPWFIARHRRHHQTTLIGWLCVASLIPVIGWVTWLVALIMAAATSPTPVIQVTPVAYRPGDVVNGHQLITDTAGARWVPVI